MRIRTIKPEFWTHPVLSSLDDGARLLAIGLLNLADDEGYFLSHATLVRNALRPFDEDSSRTRRGLETLAKVGWIDLREHSEQGQIGKVVNFKKHQRIDRATPSKLVTYFNSSSPLRAIVESSLLEGNGKDQGKDQGMDGLSTSDRGQIPLPTAEAESGQPSPVTADASTSKRYTDARIVLHALNETAGRHYRETQTNLDFIRARLSEPDVTVDGCIAMIRRQVARWGNDPKMVEFLRPETLFNRTKFDAYYAARDLPATAPETAGGRASVSAQRNAMHGPDVDAHVNEAWERSRAVDAEVERRMAEDPAFLPFGERSPEVPAEGFRHG